MDGQGAWEEIEEPVSTTAIKSHAQTDDTEDARAIMVLPIPFR